MSAYGVARSIARRAGVGRVRGLVRDGVDRSDAWVAVPPRRLKDIDTGRALPPNTAALTFDDGPDPRVTPRLLHLLDDYSAHATFFMCGLAAQRHPQLVRAVLGAGHTIGGHTWDHTVVMRDGLPEPVWHKQIDDTHALLADIAGAAIPWFRPPRGIIDRATWQRLRGQGLATVLWSIDGRDCTLREPEVIARRVTDSLAPGEITLLHDSNANFLFSDIYPPQGEVGNQESTLVATKKILEVAAVHEYTFVSLEDMTGWVMPHRGRLRILPRHDTS